MGFKQIYLRSPLLIMKSILGTSRLFSFFLMQVIALVLAPANLAVAESGPVRKIVVEGDLGFEGSKIGIEPGTGQDHTLSSSIAVGPNGNIFIADNINNKVVRFGADGKFLDLFPFPPNMKPSSNGSYWDGTYRNAAMTTDSTGHLYIVPRFERGRVYKFTPEGKFSSVINLKDNNVLWNNGLERFNAKTGTWKNGRLQVSRIVVTPDGSIYLRGTGELVKFSPAGELLQKWPLEGSSNFILDQHFNLLMSGYFDMKVEAYSPDGKLLWIRECEAVFPQSLIVYGINNKLCGLPRHIDKKGNQIWSKSWTSVVIKTNAQGKETGRFDVRHQIASQAEFDSDAEGNMYLLSTSPYKYMVEKVIFQ